MTEYVSENKKLQPKDFITIGIFTAIFTFITIVVGFLTAIPVFIPLITIIIPVVAGIPFMLYITKIKKFGMITISGIIVGVLTFLFGMGYPVAIISVITSVCADLILLSGNYQSKSRAVLSSGVFWVFLIGTVAPIIVARNSYYDNLTRLGMDATYIDGLTKWVPDWSLFPLAGACFAGGILGGLFGLSVLRRHFERAGVAG